MDSEAPMQPPTQPPTPGPKRGKAFFSGRTQALIWSWAGAAVGLLILVWLLRGTDWDELARVARDGDPFFLMLLVLGIVAEQIVRSWKWRQIIKPVKSVGVLRLFGAIMAGYLGSFIVPFGMSPLIRSWLIARTENLEISMVLATTAVDRIVDGIVFSIFVAAALLFMAIPDPSGEIRGGLFTAGATSLAIFVFAAFLLADLKRDTISNAGWLIAIIGKLPARAKDIALRLLRSFAAGIVWPNEPWRRYAVIGASVTMKLIAAGHFLWGGLAFGVVLRPTDYILVLVFLGFLVILTRMVRIPGGFVVGGIFILELLDVPPAPALATVLAVQTATLLVVSTVGGLSFWRNGITLRALKKAG